MGKKGALTSIFSRLADDSHSPAAGSAAPPPWPWPSCRSPQAASFRADDDEPCTTAAALARRGAGGEMYKTVNSVFFDSADESCFDGEGEDDEDRFSTATASEEWSEAVIRSLGRKTSTGRFFFDPGPPTSSILAAAPSSPAATPPPPEAAEAKAAESEDSEEKLLDPCPGGKSLAEESVAVAVDSDDPYGDFRASMEEMVTAHGLRSWEALEELLVWYLRVNAKHNHALIVGVFVDLLVGLTASPPSTAAATTTTTTTATTITTSSSSSASTSSSSASTGTTYQ